MSQLIACKNQNGVVLAADSKALNIDASGKVLEHSITRLHRLTEHSVMLCGGALEGERIVRAFKSFISEENLGDVETLYNAALPFLASEYTEFMRKACRFQPLDPVHHLHFILAGRSSREADTPFRMYFLWTKKKRPQLDGDEISVAFTVPRMIRLEYTLSQMTLGNSGLTRIQEAIAEAMTSQAGRNEEVGGPFQYAVITQDGIRIIEG